MGVLTTTIREEKEINDIEIGKEGKLSLFLGGMILYVENPKHTIKILLQLINNLCKVVIYKINIQKISCVSIH